MMKALNATHRETTTLSDIAVSLRVGIAATVLALVAGCASHTAQNVSVSDANAAADGTQLVVTGEIVQQIDKEHILLRDSSGQINVTVDDDILGKVKFAPDSRVRILGRVDRNSERSVLVAKTVQVVQ